MGSEDIGEETLPRKLGWLLVLVVTFAFLSLNQFYGIIPLGPDGSILWICVSFLIVVYVYWISFDVTLACIRYIRRFRAK